MADTGNNMADNADNRNITDLLDILSDDIGCLSRPDRLSSDVAQYAAVLDRVLMIEDPNLWGREFYILSAALNTLAIKVPEIGLHRVERALAHEDEDVKEAGTLALLCLAPRYPERVAKMAEDILNQGNEDQVSILKTDVLLPLARQNKEFVLPLLKLAIKDERQKIKRGGINDDIYNQLLDSFVAIRSSISSRKKEECACPACPCKPQRKLKL